MSELGMIPGMGHHPFRHDRKASSAGTWETSALDMLRTPTI